GGEDRASRICSSAITFCTSTSLAIRRFSRLAQPKELPTAGPSYSRARLTDPMLRESLRQGSPTGFELHTLLHDQAGEHFGLLNGPTAGRPDVVRSYFESSKTSTCCSRRGTLVRLKIAAGLAEQNAGNLIDESTRTGGE